MCAKTSLTIDPSYYESLGLGPGLSPRQVIRVVQADMTPAFRHSHKFKPMRQKFTRLILITYLKETKNAIPE